LDEAGHILTNNHVISGAANNQVQVTLADGRLHHATIVGGDTFTDLAVILLQDPPNDLHPVALGDSDSLFVGDPVLAVGNPLGLAGTITTGVISAVNRPVTATGQDGLMETVTNAIQVDAAINPGNSGGPLFDHEGRVIGVTSSIATLSTSIFGGSSGSIGLGFAIPINLARNISAQLIENGTAQHPRLGVRLLPGTATTGGVTRRGARIEQVDAGTAAAAAGLQVGDVVIAINGLPVDGSNSLTGFVRERSVGDVIELTIVRNGQIITVSATLGAMTEVAEVPVPDPEGIVPPLGDGSEPGIGDGWLDEYGDPFEMEPPAPPANGD
jgi:putative serine protease PepD